MSTIPSSIIERKRLFDENESPTSYSMINSDMIQYYQVLAEGGDALAQVALGQLHYHGFRGVAKDHRKALKFLKMAASSGNSNAMAFLGKVTIEKNTAAGYCGLGTMYLYGKGVKVDYAKAFVNFNKAAEQGLVEAQYQIGIMYYNGYGVFQNYQEAFKYFFLASQAGYALGYYYLGILHAEGLGTVKSCTNAVELFKNVAERGQWSKILMEAFANYKDSKVFSSYLKYSFLSELGYEVAQSLLLKDIL
ncbi:hypothetical protein RND71_043759 [Anisodus tanguticus]|uniref:Uncharacterized protein n=1 Tax=Anisodus tanguticus TaxID=243964 RepID=A0AAE1QP96_9SOLA|nr:hypothetical protein RND71_043759 [Anisodus tanguticus]